MMLICRYVIRDKEFDMPRILMAAIVVLVGFTPAAVVWARAGTLLKCEGITTANGFRYVGTYCVDYQCQYVNRHIFNTWCPYTLN
jgi:hypothetical protein